MKSQPPKPSVRSDVASKHTPLPWTLGKGSKTIREASKPGRPGFIARTHMPGEYTIRTDDEQEANANLIVQAVNSHAALVQAVQACKKYMDDPKGSDITGQQALGAINYALSLLAGQEE